MYDTDQSQFSFFGGFMVIGVFFIFMGWIFYSEFTQDNRFHQTLKDNHLTLVSVQDALNVRDRNCTYQINFIGLTDQNEKVRAKYCEASFNLGRTLQIREKI